MNIADILNILILPITSALGWFSDVLASIEGAEGLLLAGFSMALCTALLIGPLRGSGSSDRSKKSKKNSDSGGDD